MNNQIDMPSPIYKVPGLMVCLSICYLGDGCFDTGSRHVVLGLDTGTSPRQSCHPKIKRDRSISIVVVSRLSLFNHRVSKKGEI